MPSPTATHPAYRPDIDGLRAVAVLSVVAFHARPHWLPGGFVGVDVFFVISGFLICSIILKSLANGRFQFSDFYMRRIRRIFPALVLMLTTVSVVGWFVLYPDEHATLGKHIAAGTGFIANIIFWREAGYFDAHADLKPLLHLWSLGIEEQFYIVWPLLLYFTWRWRWLQWPLILGIALLSFTLNVLLVAKHPHTAFYLPPTRLWELLLGCALAYAQLFNARAVDFGPRVRNAQALVGATLLLAAVALLDQRRIFPGWWALMPTVGAVLLISAGPQAWVNRLLLGNRLMVAIGLISYPLYIWHWPLLSFVHILAPDHRGMALPATAVALAFVLAILTYRYVELPIRHGTTSTRQFVAPLAAQAVLLCAFGVIAFLGVLPPRSAAYGVARYIRPAAESAFPGPNLKTVDIASGSVLVQGATRDQILFIGDSNIEQYYPRLNWLLTRHPEASRGIVFVSSGGCAPIPYVTETHHPDCDHLLERALTYAQSDAVQTVVIGAAWYSYFVDHDDRYDYQFDDGHVHGQLTLGTPAAEHAFQALATLLGNFRQAGKRVYLILPIPADELANPRGMIKRSFTELNFRIEASPLNRLKLAQAYQPLKTELIEVARRTNTSLIDPFDELCHATSCATVDEAGDPIYLDSSHLRPSYVRNNIHFLDEIVLQGTAGTSDRSKAAARR